MEDAGVDETIHLLPDDIPGGPQFDVQMKLHPLRVVMTARVERPHRLEVPNGVAAQVVLDLGDVLE